MDNIETQNVADGDVLLADTFASELQIGVDADLAATFTFASHQNSIPVIRSIRIENQNAESIENVRLELTASPAFLRAKNWTVDRIAAGDRVTLSDRRIELDASYLAGLDEAERGDITLRLMQAERILAETVVPVRLLARDEWGGVTNMGQLLPAFVMPNDPAIFPLLRSAAERLAAHGHSSALDGYQSGDPKRTYMLIAAVYSAVAALGLHYAQPPASFERQGQKVRGPSKVVRDRLATCLDTTLLFAAALEAAGLNAVVLLLDGHACVGTWLVKRTLPKTIEDDVAEVRKAIAAREFIVLETTGVTHRPVMTFEQARKVGEAKLDENAGQRFVSAVDVARSRSGGIMPLASHETGQPDAVEEGDGPSDIALPAEPDLPMPADIVDQKPTTPAGRIDRWQNRLLDLSLRNRLLNFSDSKRTVSFLCPDVAYLEDRLADGAAIKLISLPEQNPLGQRDAELHREKRGLDLHRGFASEALQRDEMASMLEPKELFARLTALYRQAKSDITEGGTNTLYLAVGLLKWKKKPTDERIYRAPLLLLPVKLERTGASDRFRLRFHEDEPRLNATLMQFLKVEFDLLLPDFRDGFPQDGNGIDVLQLLDQIRRAVRDTPGLEVADDVALSTFSFAKYLMWKDLTERTDALRQNRVVRHLIDNPERAFVGAEEPFPDEGDVDRAYAPADIVMPLPADSSQIAASLAATQGRDFVIVGPPGTGKSQTIANMIASCLAARKTVLFVAEKTAALDVVYRRLREHGLGDHCLELHSNKTDRKHFFAQLKRSWEKRGGSGESEWVTLNERLQIRRDELNAYVAALHERAPNGLTPYAAMGIATAGRDSHAPALQWPSMNAHDARAYGVLDDLAAQLGQTFAAVTMRPVLRLIQVEEWTGAWQEQLLATARVLGRTAAETEAALERLSKRFGLAGVACCADGLGYFANLARDLIATSGADHTIILHKDFATLARSVGDLERAIATYRGDEARLSQVYAPDAIARIPVDDLDREWRKAMAAVWPKSWFAARRIRRLLGSYSGSNDVDPAIDLSVIRKLQGVLQDITANELARAPLAFAGLDTDCSGLRQYLECAGRLRTSLLQLGEFAGDVRSLAASIAAGLKGEVNEPQLVASKEFIARYQEFNAAIAAFESHSGKPIGDRDAEDFLGRLSRQMDELEQSRNLFRDWSSWCAVRGRAVAQGLGPLVSDLECGAIRPGDALAAFRLAYARWWLPLAIDNSAELRRFRRFQHENAITDFCAIDDRVRAHASKKVVNSLVHGLPAADAVPRKSELGLLRHQMTLQRPSASIREMIGAMPESFSRLAPCLLMSPLSIAQYLPTQQALFDVVIFDEASQIATWDAVGAIARGRQTIIVGDPKQLPPTNFFERSDVDGGDIPQHEQDLESILDEAQASGLPTRQLRWHYRSRHESLIAFSNWHYYGNNLITFPSPVTEDQAVSLAFVPAGVYDRGKSRTNREEARAIVADVRTRLEAWLALPEPQRPTLGVITFNMPQQSLILDLLDDARRDNPELEWFFSDDRIEPVIVKNLENIQGDERDVILFSITYCRDAANKLPMSFGAINNNGGERRLNVAVTRARRELKVFSGIRCDDIDLGRSRAIGVQHLKAFLDYAVRGAIALPAQDAGSQGPMESPFEEAVAAKLERRGWQIVPQVGVSGFRIDLAVRHPDHAGLYLAGIECDGATYHSSATARDRDKVREQVLRGLGWTILRVWSTDWWFNSEEAIERLQQGLEGALAESRAAHVAEAESRAGSPAGEFGKDLDDSATEADAITSPVPGDANDPVADIGATASAKGRCALPYLAAEKQVVGGAQPTFSVADLSAFNPDPVRFFEHSYRPTLQAMVDAIMEREAPLREDVLAQRVARAHGWLRTGARIRERIALHLRDLDRTEESSGTFLWKPGTIAPRVPFREPLHAQHRRALSDICLAEIVDFVMMHRTALDEDDPPLVYARLLQVDRLASSSRERLNEAILQAQAFFG
jgi:very-short-patch-repair endonuclease